MRFALSCDGPTFFMDDIESQSLSLTPNLLILASIVLSFH